MQEREATEASVALATDPHLQIHTNENQNANNGLPRSLATSRNDDKADLKTLKTLLESLPTPPPHGWEKVKLGSVISLEYGKPLQENRRVKGEYVVVGSNGIVGYHNEFIVKAPAIIVGRKGSAGKVTYITTNCYPIDTTFYVVDKAHNNFKMLYFILQGLDLEKSQIGIGVPGINRNDVYNLKIPCPPKDFQDKIVKTIDFIESKITQLEALSKDIEGSTQEILQNVLN